MENETHSSVKRYPSELKDRAVRMVEELRRDDPRDQGIITRVARQLGVGADSLRAWVRQSHIDAGNASGVTTTENAEIARLKKENFELKRANDILKAASIFFATELDGPRSK
jgi:transposase